MTGTTQTSASQLMSFYDNLTLHIVPGPKSLRYFLPFLLLYTSLLCPPILRQPSRRSIAVLLIVGVQLYIWHQDSSFDVISMNAMLSTFMLLGWYNIRKDFKKQKQTVAVTQNSANKETSLESYPQSLQRRMIWVIDLLSAIRFTGWNTPANATRSLPTRPWKDSTRSFYLTTIVNGVFHYLLLDCTSSYVSQSPAFVYDAMDYQRPWQTDVFVVLVHVYAALALYNAFLPIALTVVLAPFPGLVNNPNISPLCWPGHFGPLSSIWASDRRRCGLRAFWGTFWHQNMRYVTSTPGVALAWLLGCKKGTSRAYLLVVAISFLFSGIVHTGVVPPQPLQTDWSCWQLRTRLAAFFWVQPIGIAMEIVVFSLMKNVKHELMAVQITVVIWTVMFLALSMWYTIVPVGKELNWWAVYLVPFSIVSLYTT